MKVIRVLLMCLASLIGLLVSVGPVSASAGATAAVTVVPSVGLKGGDTVAVRASGVPASTTVQVIECDMFVGADPSHYPDLVIDPDQDCYPRTTATANSSGAVSVAVTLVDPVYRAQEEGDPRPIYCRADICRIFLAWKDSNGEVRSLASKKLFFTGAPATIVASPASDLRKRQWIKVTGTAYGAPGHTIRITEEACYSIIQGSGCYGALQSVWTRVRPDGTYGVLYRAQRFLADGTDCADSQNILGFCEMNVAVFTKGSQDDSFGVSRRGQPAAALTFRTG